MKQRVGAAQPPHPLFLTLFNTNPLQNNMSIEEHPTEQHWDAIAGADYPVSPWPNPRLGELGKDRWPAKLLRFLSVVLRSVVLWSGALWWAFMLWYGVLWLLGLV